MGILAGPHKDYCGRRGETQRSAAQLLNDSSWLGNRNTALNGMMPGPYVPLE